MRNNMFGVIDIGSNTIRLVLFKKNDWGFTEEQNLKVPARLRSYMTEDQLMTEEGVDIVIDSLKKFENVINHYKVEAVDAVATAAVRQAKNRDEILKKAEQETDFTIRILSEREEAYYGYLSVVQTMNVENGYTVDMGGGSTEVTLIKDREMVEYHSFPFGALSLFNRFIKNEQPGKSELKQLSEFLKEQFDSIPWLKKRSVPLVGIGGSARNMALIHQASRGYPLSGIHHYEMPVKDLKKTEDMLLGLSYSERKKVDGLSKERADIIIPAIHGLSELSEYVAAESFLLCRSGLREGVMYDHLANQSAISQQMKPREKGIQNMIAKYEIDEHNTQAVSRLAMMMVKELEQAGKIKPSSEFLEIMQLAAKVFYLGEHLESEASSQHTFYILSNSSIEGMNHRNRVSFALLASFKSSSTFQDYVKPFASWYSKEELFQLETLGAILKLAYFLNVTNQSLIEDVSLDKNKQDDELVFTFTCNKDPYFEEDKSKKHKKHLEKKIDMSLSLEFEQV